MVSSPTGCRQQEPGPASPAVAAAATLLSMLCALPALTHCPCVVTTVLISAVFASDV
jgi:hypothetical protein